MVFMVKVYVCEKLLLHVEGAGRDQLRPVSMVVPVSENFTKEI